MRVAVVEGQPHHAWILAPIAAAFAAAGDSVIRVAHRPAHPHDWLSERSIRHAPRTDVDAVIAADGPYAPLREHWPRALVVAVRSSLASSGNTWDHVHVEGAHVVPTWSTWDEMEHARHGCRLPAHEVRTGPAWLASAPRDPQPATRARHRVLWAPSSVPTWRRTDEVARALAGLVADGWGVTVRPHPHTGWRERGWVDEVAHAGLRVDGAAVLLDDPDAAPWGALGSVDAVIADAGGCALLACAWPDVRVLWVDPPAGTLRTHARHDPAGPEWRYRDVVGTRVEPDGIALALSLPDTLAARVDRARVWAAIVGPDPWGAPARLRARLAELTSSRRP